MSSVSMLSTFTSLLLLVGGIVIGTMLTHQTMLPGKKLLEEEEEDEVDGVVTARSVKINQAHANMEDGLLTALLGQLWSHINVAGCQIIRDCVEPALALALPAPLNTMKFTKLDLGKTPLRLDNILVHKRKIHTNADGSTSNSLQFDVDVVWDGDCQISLKADYVGAIGVQTIKFKGRLRILLKPLTNELPVIGAVQYCFLNPPSLDLDFTGLAQVADVKVVKKKINAVINDILAGMLVLPHRMGLKMDPAISFVDIYEPPLGVLRITLLRGSGFQEEKRKLLKADIPDVYAKIKLGTYEAWQSSTSHNSLKPVWNAEYCDFVLSSRQQLIQLEAWDEDRGSVDKDDELGQATLDVHQLMNSTNNTLEIKLKDLKSNRYNGTSLTVKCDLLPLCTVQNSTVLSSLTVPNTHAMQGLVTILVTQAFGVPALSNEELQKPAAVAAGGIPALVKLTYGKESKAKGKKACLQPKQYLFQTGCLVGQDPCFDAAFQVPLFHERDGQDLTMEVYQYQDAALTDLQLLGTTVVTHAQLTAAPDATIREKRSIGADSGTCLEYQVSLQGVDAANYLAPKIELGTGTPHTSPDKNPYASLAPAPSKVRVTAVKGRGFQVEKRRLKGMKADIPDVYCKITCGSDKKNPKFKTSVVKDSLEPVWNESVEFLYHQENEIVTVHAWDEDKLDDDDLGCAQISIGELLDGQADTELELTDKKGSPTGAFVMLRGNKMGSDKVDTIVEPAATAPTALPKKVAAPVSTPAPKSPEAPASIASTPTPTPVTNAIEREEPMVSSVRLTIEQGRGFQIEKRRLQKDDIPDVYCKISCSSSKVNPVFKTSTIKNSLCPAWNESVDFAIDDTAVKISIQAWDEDTGDDDDLGRADISVAALLKDGTTELELSDKKGKATGAFVTLHCQKN